MVSGEITTALSPTATSGASRAAVPGLLPLVRMELRKFFKRPMAWTLYALIVAILIANTALAYIVYTVKGELDRMGEFLAFPQTIPQALELMGAFGIIFMAVLGAGMVGSEYGWGTMRVLVSSGQPRGRIFGAKVVAATIAAIGWLLAGLASSMLTSLVVTIIGPFSIAPGSFDAAWFGKVALMLARSGYVVVVLVLVALSVATISRSLAAGIAVPVVWTIGEQIGGQILPMFGRFGTIVGELLLTVNIGSLMNGVTFGEPRDWSGPSAARAVVVLAGYAAVLLTAAYLVFRRRDLTAGS